MAGVCWVEMSRKEGEKLIMPGQIVHCVMARQDTNEPNRLIAASIGLARPADAAKYGYLSEHHSYGETAKKAGDFLNFINPFSRHSPSLVDQVRDGSRLMAAHFGRMADDIEGHAKRGQLALVAMGGTTPGGSVGLAVGGSQVAVLAAAIRDALKPTGTSGTAGAAASMINNFYGDVKPDQGLQLGRDIAWQLKGSPR